MPIFSLNSKWSSIKPYNIFLEFAIKENDSADNMPNIFSKFLVSTAANVH